VVGFHPATAGTKERLISLETSSAEMVAVTTDRAILEVCQYKLRAVQTEHYWCSGVLGFDAGGR
jgi:hypothetical protein